MAAPKSVSVSYQLLRNDKVVGQITETYQQQGNQYKIQSVTEGAGLLALAGKRILTSQGLVTADGLQPQHFELHQGDNDRKTLMADFDWGKAEISMKVKGNSVSHPLQKGTQDLASYAYQWMFAPPSADAISVALTTGKKLREYQFQVIERDVIVVIANQQYQTLTLSNTTESGEERLISLSTQHANLPVRVLIRDENGAVTEQVLTNIRIEY